MAIGSRVHAQLAGSALATARPGVGSNALGDAFLEEIHARQWRRRAGRALPVRRVHDQGGAVRVWQGDALRMASADGPPGPALISCLRRMELPAVQAAARSVQEPLAAGGMAEADPGGRQAAYLEKIEDALCSAWPGLRWSLSLEDRRRLTLVVDEREQVQTGDLRWVRLTLAGRGEAGQVAWAGGAADLPRLQRTWAPADLLTVLERRLRGRRDGGTRPRCLPDTPVVFAAGNGAMLLHEMVHGLEGDQRLRGWSPWGAETTPLSPLLTLWDDPTRPGMRGSYRHDDEGRPSCRRLLVRQGRIVGGLGDRRHVDGRAGLSEGHGRRASRHHPPRPRSANLCMAAGDMPTEAMAVMPRPVLWVHDLEAASTDPCAGHVCLRVSDGEWFQDGRSLGAVSGVALQGWLPEVLAAIDRVGRERVADKGAITCAREGEGVPISFLTPAFRTYGLLEAA